LAKVIRLEYARAERLHPLAKDSFLRFACLRILPDLEDRLAVNPLDCRFSRTHAAKQVAQTPPGGLLEHIPVHRADVTWSVTSQQGAERSDLHTSIRNLADHVDRGEGAQQPPKGRRVRRRCRSQVVD